MSRPKPKVLLDKAQTMKTLKGPREVNHEILQADGIYAVFYKNQPFNLRTRTLFANEPGPKYRKVSFSNKGHAVNLAGKLNAFFNTKDFAVVKLTKGDPL